MDIRPSSSQTGASMPSRCRPLNPLLDTTQLPLDGLRYPPGSAFSKCNAPNVRTVEPELPRNAGEQVRVHGRPAEFGVRRGIFKSHIVEGHNGALSHKNILHTNIWESSRKQGGNGEAGVPSVPEWSKQIESLMGAQGLTQAGVAAKLNVSQGSVSMWLAGKREPRWETYFRIAKIWPHAEQAQYFAQRAVDMSGGLPLPGAERFLNQLRRRPQSGPSRKGEAVFLPLLKDSAAAGGQLDEQEIESVWAAPAPLVPHPDQTLYIRIKGDSMSPLLEDGYIAAIDMAQTEPERLYNQMVAARSPGGDVSVRWLRKVGAQGLLLAQRTSPRQQPVMLNDSTEEDGWQVIGKVLWWIGML